MLFIAYWLGLYILTYHLCVWVKQKTPADFSAGVFIRYRFLQRLKICSKSDLLEDLGNAT